MFSVFFFCFVSAKFKSITKLICLHGNVFIHILSRIFLTLTYLYSITETVLNSITYVFFLYHWFLNSLCLTIFNRLFTLNAYKLLTFKKHNIIILT